MDAGYAFSVIAGAALALGALTAIFASLGALISSRGRKPEGEDKKEDDEGNEGEGG